MIRGGVRGRGHVGGDSVGVCGRCRGDNRQIFSPLCHWSDSRVYEEDNLCMYCVHVCLHSLYEDTPEMRTPL